MLVDWNTDIFPE